MHYGEGQDTPVGTCQYIRNERTRTRISISDHNPAISRGLSSFMTRYSPVPIPTHQLLARVQNDRIYTRFQLAPNRLRSTDWEPPVGHRLSLNLVGAIYTLVRGRIDWLLIKLENRSCADGSWRGTCAMTRFPRLGEGSDRAAHRFGRCGIIDAIRKNW